MAEVHLSLDDAREALFTLMRACERHTAQLKVLVDALNAKQPEEGWLTRVQEETGKTVAFHEQQLSTSQQLLEQVAKHVDAVRAEAEQLAMDELAGVVRPPPAEGEVAKFKHPELLQFKLEKQAKILGKYGGAPALGAGLVLPRLPRDAHLKATGSPAAREIQYSKVENTDAAQLAKVMQFRARTSSGSGASQGGMAALLNLTPEQSPWQAEASARKGKTRYDGTDDKDMATPVTASHTPYASELGGALQRRQAALAEAAAAEAAAAKKAPVTPGGLAAAGSELADKLKRRQSVAEQAAAAAAAAAAAEAAASTPATPPTTSWSDPSAPFGAELSRALQQRSVGGNRSSSGTAGAGSSSSREAMGDAPATPVPAPQANGGASTSFTTPAAQGTAGSAVRRTPSNSWAATASAAATAQKNELAEMFRKRASMAEQTPS